MITQRNFLVCVVRLNQERFCDMERMTGQTKIIVATACCLALVDIAVRVLLPSPPSGGVSGCSTCPALSGGDGVVTARAIRLVDNNGNVRGLWNTDQNGEPALWMYDRNGATRIELDSTENTPSLSLHDTDGNRRVYFGMNREDGSGLYLMKQSDGQTVTFSLDGSGDTSRIELMGGGNFTQTMTTSGKVKLRTAFGTEATAYGTPGNKIIISGSDEK